MARNMKDSGIEWIGEIPEGWSVSKVLHCLSMPITDGPHTTPILYDTGIPFVSAEAVSCGNGRIDFSHIRGYISEQFYKECCQKYVPEIDDIYMIKSGATTGRVAIVDTTRVFTIWSPLAVFRCNKDCMLPKFLYYYLQSPAFQKEVEFGWTFGTQQNVGMRSLEQMKVCVPQLNKQDTIANYLDYQCSQIDLLLQKALTSIEEYKKLKQAVITQAVTKGVRGKREMKDSRVEWAGLVPHHWGVAKIGSIGQTSSGATPLRSKESSFFDDATIRWVRTLDLNDGLVYDSSEKITELALASSACSIMPKGTVCVAMYGGAGTIGKCGLLMSDCATNQAVCSIVCNREIVSPIFLLMQLLALKSYWMKYAVGTRKDPNISQDVVARMKILIPPLDEQKEITDYLDTKCTEIDKLIAKKEQLVKELESYKKSLIYEVVTGKREV